MSPRLLLCLAGTFGHEAAHAGLCSDEPVTAQRAMDLLPGRSGNAVYLLESQDRWHLIARRKLTALDLAFDLLVDLDPSGYAGLPLQLLISHMHNAR